MPIADTGSVPHMVNGASCMVEYAGARINTLRIITGSNKTEIVDQEAKAPMDLGILSGKI